MADTDALKKYLDAGMAFTHLTRARAEQVVKDLVAAGELQRGQAKSAIDDLLERSRKNAETLSEQVRKEVDSQLASLGLARKADVERLEAELAELKGDKGAGAKLGAGKGDGGEAPSKPAQAKKAGKSAAPAKTTKKAAATGASPVSTELPGKAKDATGDAPAPAKKAAKATKATTAKAKEGGDQPAAPADKAMPGKKTAKKQG